MKKILPLVLLFVIFISFVYSVPVLILNDDNFRPTETVVAEMTISTGAEKNSPYTVEWWGGGSLQQTDSGTTPNGFTPFFETFDIPAGVTWVDAYANFTIGTVSDIAYFNVSGNNSNLLTITDVSFAQAALPGNLFSIIFKIEDENNLGIDNAECLVYGTDITGAPLQSCGVVTSHNQVATCSDFLDEEVFNEGQQYLAVVRCNCGLGDNACFDENGNPVVAHAGSDLYPFTVGSWLTINTITDKNSYTLNDEYIYVCANITNNQNYRISLDIIYNYRCGGQDNSTERVVIDSYEELRGISANTTQNQCAALEIKNIKSIQNKVNSCYAATDVRVLSEDGLTSKLTYPTTNVLFNITSNSLIENTEDDNMLSIVLVFMFFIIYFTWLGWVLRGNKKRGMRFMFYSLALIELLILSFIVYANYVGIDLTGILYIVFMVNLLIGGLFGIIGLFLYVLREADLQEGLEDEPDGDVEPKWEKNKKDKW